MITIIQRCKETTHPLSGPLTSQCLQLLSGQLTNFCEGDLNHVTNVSNTEGHMNFLHPHQSVSIKRVNHWRVMQPAPSYQTLYCLALKMIQLCLFCIRADFNWLSIESDQDVNLFQQHLDDAY